MRWQERDNEQHSRRQVTHLSEQARGKSGESYLRKRGLAKQGAGSIPDHRRIKQHRVQCAP